MLCCTEALKAAGCRGYGVYDRHAVDASHDAVAEITGTVKGSKTVRPPRINGLRHWRPVPRPTV